MERLNAGALRRLRTFMEDTSVACDLTSFSSVVLPAVQKLVPSTVVCYAQVDPVGRKLVAQETVPGFAHDDRDAFEQHMLEHPVFQAWAKSGVTAAVRRSDLIGRQEWHRSGLYQLVYKGWGCEDSMPIGLPAPEGLLACICSERDTEFTDLEMQLMELARPHIVQIYRNAEMFALLAGSVGATGTQSIAVDALGRPLLASQGAWNLLARFSEGEPLIGVGFPSSVRSWLGVELRRLSEGVSIFTMGRPLVITRQDGRSLHLRLLPGSKTGEQALIVLEEIEVPEPPRVSEDWGLSPREQEILAHVRSGLSSAGIADCLSISRRTVEKHLENIYCKLGVENRTAAVTVAFASKERGTGTGRPA